MLRIGRQLAADADARSLERTGLAGVLVAKEGGDVAFRRRREAAQGVRRTRKQSAGRRLERDAAGPDRTAARPCQWR